MTLVLCFSCLRNPFHAGSTVGSTIVSTLLVAATAAVDKVVVLYTTQNDGPPRITYSRLAEAEYSDSDSATSSAKVEYTLLKGSLGIIILSDT